MKKNTFKKIFSLLALVTIFLIHVPKTSAQQQGGTVLPTDYAVLVPLPGTTYNCPNNPGVECSDLERYLPAAFNLTIGIAVALAFIVITYGGVLYATSDALSGKSAGREAIENALWGLLLVIGAYVILQTINPRMLDFTLRIDQFTTNANQTAANSTGGVIVPAPCCTYTTNANGTRILNGYTLTPAQQQQNTAIRDTLHNGGVEVNNGPCTTGGTQGCTNVVGLSTTVINRLIALKSACSSAFADCLLTVTGGTEGGHATHGPNNPMVDISPNASINAYFAKTNPQARTPVNGTVVQIPGGGTATYETTGANGRASGNHWHIQF